jgi:hypothetical protein
MLGGLFGRAKKQVFPSRHEAFAAFQLAQFMPQYHWEIPAAELDEWTHDAGAEFQNVSQMWFLIYCAWLFRLASIHRFGNDFQKDVMAALRMRLAKHNESEIGPLKELPNLLEFWFQKLDLAAMEAKAKPTVNGQEAPITFPAAIAFIALDESSPWHMNPNAPNASVFNVTLALAKVHDRMLSRMPGIVDLISKQ